MRLLSLNPTGMFSYGYSDTIELADKGVVHLIGRNEDKDFDSNGSGKSSLFNALCEILWGENPTGVSGEKVANTRLEQGFCGRVEFESSGSRYRVTSCRDWEKAFFSADNDNGCVYAGTALFFDTLKSDVWVDLRGPSMKETRDLVISALGQTYDRFLATSYLSPRAGNVLLKGSNKERMDIMGGVLGLGEWDRITERCRAEKRETEKRKGELEKQRAFEAGFIAADEAQLTALSATDWVAEIEKQKGIAAGLESSIVELEKTKVELVEKIEQLKNIDRSVLNGLNDQKRELEHEVHAINELSFFATNRVVVDDSEIRHVQAELAVCEKQTVLRKVPNRSAWDAEHPIDSTNHDVLSRDVEIANLNGRLRTARSDMALSVALCPTCGAPIAEDRKQAAQEALGALEHSLANLLCQREQEIQDFDARLDLLKKQRDASWAEFLSELEESKAAEETELVNKTNKLRETLEELKHRYEAAVADGMTAVRLKWEAELTRKVLLSGQVGEIGKQIAAEEAVLAKKAVELNGVIAHSGEVSGEISKNRAVLGTLATWFVSAADAVRRVESVKASLEARKLTVADIDKTLAAVAEDLAAAEWLIHHIPFVKLHKLAVSLGELSVLANNYLSEAGDTLRVHISSFKEKKKKTAASAADLLKSEITIEITDGEKKIDPKLYSDGETSRVSTAMVRAVHDLAVKFHQGCNIILLDEIFGWVDHSSSQKVAATIRAGAGETVLVTDNSGKSGILKFDGTWVARKKNGVTTLEVFDAN